MKTDVLSVVKESLREINHAKKRGEGGEVI